MDIFYSSAINTNSCIITEEEAIHCSKVLRHKKGDIIEVIDGKGTTYLTKIDAITGKNVICTIIESRTQNTETPCYIRMLVAPTKNIDRYEFFVEKAVEFGINELIPIATDNSERKIVKKDRTERIILSAMKQSKKAYMPLLHEITPFKECVSKKYEGITCIAHCENSLKKSLKEFGKPSEISILIGPEGDFSTTEIALANSLGWENITLGNARLRTETAGLAAVHSIHYLFE